MRKEDGRTWQDSKVSESNVESSQALLTDCSMFKLLRCAKMSPLSCKLRTGLPCWLLAAAYEIKKTALDPDELDRVHQGMIPPADEIEVINYSNEGDTVASGTRQRWCYR
jgi:hypothetical protein